MFVERMREKFSAEASDEALLQPGVPARGSAMVAIEEPAAVPAFEEWTSETPETKRTLPATGASSNAGESRRRRARVITIEFIENIFSEMVVIVRAAM